MADVLIIDDDIDIADVLSEMMRAEGHEVRIAYNGEEGLRLARERLPDVALLDVEMPVLGGPAMAYQMYVRDHGLETVPVVLLSGVINLEQVAKQVGTPYFLAKPYRHGPVVALVRRALAERIAPLPPEYRSPMAHAEL
ncbi:MAG: Two-component response regulator [Myxococcales bacterium]|nr:Two-component response regulator [Myxococcales bacterium]